MMRLSAIAMTVRLGVHLALLVALGLGFVWPLVDPQAIERDPSHTHLVLGGTEAARSEVLAAHLHAGLAFDPLNPTQPVEPAPEQHGVRVIVFGSHEGATGWSFGEAAKTVLPPMFLAPACLTLVSYAVPWLNPLHRPPALRRLDPPPRLPA